MILLVTQEQVGRGLVLHLQRTVHLEVRVEVHDSLVLVDCSDCRQGHLGVFADVAQPINSVGVRDVDQVELILEVNLLEISWGK